MGTAAIRAAVRRIDQPGLRRPYPWSSPGSSSAAAPAARPAA